MIRRLLVFSDTARLQVEAPVVQTVSLPFERETVDKRRPEAKKLGDEYSLGNGDRR